MFETTDVNQCPGAYTCEKFLNFCIGVLQAPKKLAPEAVFWVGCLLPAYSSNGTILGDRNHLPSRHPKDVPFYASFDGGCMVWVL